MAGRWSKTLRFVLALCSLFCASCGSNVGSGGGPRFTDSDYLALTRQFAEAIVGQDFDAAWAATSVEFQARMDRAKLEKTCKDFFARFSVPRGIREPGVNETGKELALELEELETKVPRDAARAWTCVGFDADHDIKMGMILVDESGALKVGDFWLFDD